MPLSHSHAASRVLSVCLPHMEQCSALKFIRFSSGEQTFSICLCQLCPCWNPKRLPDWPSSASPKDKRTVTFLTERPLQHRATLVCWGLPVTLHCGGTGWTIIFYSTGSRPSQTTQSQPPIHAVNSRVMRAWWASITTSFSPCNAPHPLKNMNCTLRQAGDI